MYKPDEKKWKNFSRSQQLGHIAAELARATNAALQNGQEEKQWAKEAYDRALILIDACLNDTQWKGKASYLYRLRDVMASEYMGDQNPAVTRFLSFELLENLKNFQ
ncbi:MAG: hypothetical protein A2748_01585 [Candidatus Wildermuthbacteria bacterium RIFCSPHIGHO2_01_FULL_45_20]|uniref:Uncharacterized protein n=1 Tax=Candidatus Wildermuthbacteria bacterium RIFCSPHIGHO2_02_FULL_45_25 TaxID=1802450 RepID=A0A1G2R3Z4_9BACT|nr:MAG: hypothetical protein A2748_01585 [Candidatus Wildermuthbacteria bacterium RIFCSPHIGHO2_01_FULL_45_20]OHA67447.1 MAG: hypothetical protein A3C04_00785 [Candidatus Wildermuthbacteria bacterium RIFCSPHIGHO2_02_FULL_45_25]